MRIALIADTFPPLRTSGAVQLRDLSREFASQGHDLTVILPEPDLTDPWQIKAIDGVQILRLRTPQMKNVGYVRRTLAECVMPFFMMWHMRKSPLAVEKWHGVVWYAPSIFHGPLAAMLKRNSNCTGYLIIRDIFPEWAVDLGIMGRGLPYRFFDAVARYQYSIADVIGIQTQGNAPYFSDWRKKSGRTLEVLQNWLGEPAQQRSTIRVTETVLADRKVFVYAGNMGVAQGLDIVLDLAEHYRPDQSVGFLFVGRGTHADRLRETAKKRALNNVVFFDEIDPDEIPDLYAQCSVGLVALDQNHKSHNIPGKFLTYMQSGLPVLANVNADNDLAEIIRAKNVGQVSENNDLSELVDRADIVLKQVADDPDLPKRCKALFDSEFSVKQAVHQIVAAFKTTD